MMLIIILATIVPLGFAVYAIKKGMDSFEPKEDEPFYQIKKEAILKKKLAGFPAFKLSPIQDGKVEIVLAKCETQNEFKKMATAFTKAIDCKIEKRIDGLSEQVWTITKKGKSLCLSWDDMMRELTLFAWDSKDNGFIQDLFVRLEKLRQ